MFSARAPSFRGSFSNFSSDSRRVLLMLSLLREAVKHACAEGFPSPLHTIFSLLFILSSYPLCCTVVVVEVLATICRYTYTNNERILSIVFLLYYCSFRYSFSQEVSASDSTVFYPKFWFSQCNLLLVVSQFFGRIFLFFRPNLVIFWWFLLSKILSFSHLIPKNP